MRPRPERPCPSWVTALKEAADVFFRDPQGDHIAAVVYLGNRVRRDQTAVSREETALDREGVWDVREGAVHRALDSADDPAPVIGDQEARRVHQIQRESGH